MEQSKQSIPNRLKSFLVQSKRVWHVLKKPSKAEFSMVAKVSAIGILIMGAIGFIISDAMRIIGNLF